MGRAITSDLKATLFRDCLMRCIFEVHVRTSISVAVVVAVVVVPGDEEEDGPMTMTPRGGLCEYKRNPSLGPIGPITARIEAH